MSTNPWPSSAAQPDSHSVSGSAPMNENKPTHDSAALARGAGESHAAE